MVGTYLSLAGAAFLLGLPFNPPLVVVFLGALNLQHAANRGAGGDHRAPGLPPPVPAPRVSAVITALGVGLFLENLTLGLLGPQPRHFPTLIHLTPWEVAGLTITPLQVLIIVMAGALMVPLDLLVRRTLLGMAMRAISYNRPIVPLMGVPVDQVISLTFATTSAIPAAGGLLYALAYPVLDPRWASASAGVPTSPWWWGASAISGGPCWGALSVRADVFTPLILPLSTYRDFVAFSLLLVLLIFKPTGLLGRPVFERV